MIKYLLFLLTNDPRVLDADTFNRVTLDTRFPLWLTFLLAVGAVIFAWYAYRQVRDLPPKRRRILTVLRAAAYIALLLVLLQPAIRIEAEGKPSGPLPIVIDRTESMGIKDVHDLTRLKAAAALRLQLADQTGLERGLRQVHHIYGPRVSLLDEAGRKGTTNAVPPFDATQPVGTLTSLRDMIGGGLQEYRGVYCPGILLLTDGADNTESYLDPVIDDLVRRRTPVYIAAMGQANPRDVALDDISGEDIIFAGEKAKYAISASQYGYTGKVLKPRALFGSDRIEMVDFVPAQEGTTMLPLEFTPPNPGLFDLVVEIPADVGESTAENNRISRRIRVVKDRIRVLMVFGWPSWEYRYLDGAFQRDRRVTHKILLQSVDKRLFKFKQDHLIEKLPATPDEMFRNFDMVIMGCIDIAVLPPSFRDLLYRFVTDEGGGLVVLADNNTLPFSFKGTPLEQMLPVRVKTATGQSNFAQEMFKALDTPYRLELTEEGQGNPLTTFDPIRPQNKRIWDGFPPIYNLTPATELKPSTIPLVNAYVAANGPRYPAIAYHSYGKGTVLYLGFDATWYWRKEFGDRYFRDFWGKVIQFLGMPHLLGESAQARIFCDRLSTTVGERVLVTAEIRNRDYSPYAASAVAVRYMVDGSGDEHALDLPVMPGRAGMFRTTFYPDAGGRYTFKLPAEFNAEPVELLVTKVSREFQNAGVKVPLLDDLANRSGGMLFYLERASTNNYQPGPELQRIEALIALKADLEKRGRNPFDSNSFMGDWAKHILQTIAARRPAVSLFAENELWDKLGFLIITLLLLCTEYCLRKLWYLD